MAARGPISYNDPRYDAIEKQAETEIGLPRGMLATIRTRGERSNANQVSEAGAATVYQIIPQTRSGVIRNYGIDPYASPLDAARGAAHVLKESLARNNGNHAAAYAEYHGGIDRRQWGSRTRAYVQRTTGGGDLASAGGGSTFDRAKAARQRATGPNLEATFRARVNVGKPGGMTPQEAAQLDAAVADGHILPPRWYKSPPSPKGIAVLPASIIAAYNGHAMDDDPDARAAIDREVAAGNVTLPRGMRLQKPAPRTALENAQLVGRAASEGIADLGDTLLGVLNPSAVLRAGPQGGIQHVGPGREYVEAGAQAVGAPVPESDTEKLISAGVSGAAQGLVTGPLLGGASMAARIGNTALDVVSGGVSGVSQESARQAGAGPVGQIAAGLAGGMAPVGLAGTAERIASRAPRTLPEVVAETPRAAVIDESGNLTPHGQEVAARTGATPEEVHAAYEAPPEVQRGTANDQLPEMQARQATTGETVNPEVPQEKTELPPQPNAPSDNSNGPDVPPRMPQAAPEALPATALDRVNRANEFGFDLSRGQATKSFDVQDAEQRLRNSNGPEAEGMRQFAAKQVEDIKTAVQQFKEATAGNTAMTAEERGKLVQDAVRELRDNGQKGVTALYKAARELGQEVPLETTGIKQAYDRLMVEANVPDSVKAEITQEAARYGIIGKAEGTAENGVTTVKIDNGAGGQQSLKYYGTPETLRLDNAENFRKAVSALYPADGPRKLTGILKAAIDDATEQAAEKLAQYGQEGTAVPAAMKAAREAHVKQVQTFKAKDVVQKIADWKKGAEDVTSVLSPEQVVKAAFASTSDLKRIKAVLLSKPTAASKAAWRALQAHGMAEVFEKATTRTTNPAGEITDAISGAKLRSSIQSFGQDKLKVLLEPEQYNQLMRLKGAIEDATIPISGTVNHSNSGNLIMRLVKDVDNQVTAAFAALGTAVAGPAGAAIGGTIGRTISPAIKAAKETKAAAETLSNATEYTPAKAAGDTGEKPASTAQKAASATKEAGAKSLRAFIDIYGSPRVLAPVLASTTGAEQ